MENSRPNPERLAGVLSMRKREVASCKLEFKQPTTA
jgi:hypothetical protein